MRTHSASRTVLLCLLALALVYGPVKAQDPNNGKPNQFTNGQNGTPNLPIAPSMIVDKNNMLASFAADGRDTGVRIQRVQKFLSLLYPAVRGADYNRVSGLIEAEQKAVSRDAAQRHLPAHSFYVGAEARVGTDKPVYSPELTYGDTRSGLELGVAGYLQSPYTEGTSRRDGLGVSLKYIPGSLAAYTLEHYDVVQKALLNLDHLRLDLSHSLTNITIKELNDIDLRSQSPEEKLNAIRQALGITSSDLRATDTTLNGGIPPIVADRLAIVVRDLDVQTTDALGDYVEGTRRPAVAFVVGDQSYRGGDIFSGGVTASYLHRFGEGAPGVTAVAVLQYLQDSFQDRGHRSAGRLGLAAIYQDTTLKMPTITAPYSAIEQLGPPWQYKIGIEYTSPVLGLHETGAVFARYRWTPSYIEVTTTYGKDGLRKDYLNVSVGKSFTF